MTADLRKTFKRTRYCDQINVRFVYPSIPDRSMDWEATFDDYEPGALIAWGPTADTAVRNLQEMDEEQRADDTYERQYK